MIILPTPPIKWPDPPPDDQPTELFNIVVDGYPVTGPYDFDTAHYMRQQLQDRLELEELMIHVRQA